MAQRLVVIGGDAGGMSAVAQARRLRGDDLDVVVIERTGHTSYAACGLPYLVAGDVDTAEDLVARSPEEFRRQGIDVRTGHEAVAIDTGAGTVEVRELDSGATSTVGYDDLLIATGANPLRPPLPGIDAAGVFDLRTIPEALEVNTAAAGARSAVVVGAGYIGLEVAEAFRARGLAVSVVEMADQPMTTLDADMADHVSAALDRLGVDLRLGSAVQGFETDDDGTVRAVVTADDTIETSLVVVGLGVRPNSALAAEAGIPTGAGGGIVVNRRMATPVDGVWAAGDCVESFHRISRERVVIALGTHANKQGRVAGTNLAGRYATFDGVLGTAITRVGDLEVARTGLNEAEAARAGFRFVTATATGMSRAHYFPGASEVVVKMVAEHRTGRLLGAQIVGGDGAGKRIDTVATALWNGMTVEDLGGVDLSYAPPFSPVWDPVLLAAGKATIAVQRAR